MQFQRSGVSMMLVMVMLMQWPCDAARSNPVKLCGPVIAEIMSHVCHTYNSPAWDDPSAGQGSIVRRRRSIGIADQCCKLGCTWEQLNMYCKESSNSAEIFEPHLITDRSAEATDTWNKAADTPVHEKTLQTKLPPIVVARAGLSSSNKVKSDGAGEVGRARG